MPSPKCNSPLDVVKESLEYFAIEVNLQMCHHTWEFAMVIRNSSSKLVGLPPPHSNNLDDFHRFRRTFVKVITLGGASVHKFKSSF